MIVWINAWILVILNLWLFFLFTRLKKCFHDFSIVLLTIIINNKHIRLSWTSRFYRFNRFQWFDIIILLALVIVYFHAHNQKSVNYMLIVYFFIIVLLARFLFLFYYWWRRYRRIWEHFLFMNFLYVFPVNQALLNFPEISEVTDWAVTIVVGITTPAVIFISYFLLSSLIW